MKADWKMLLLAPLACLGGASAADAASPDRPAIFSRLVECKLIAEATARLACYDAQVDAFDAAEKKQDVVVMDRKQMRDTRKSLFGFSLPNFTLGGRKLDEADEVSEIQSEVASVRRSGYAWILVLKENAGSWESSELNRDPPKPGYKIRIKRGTMGSYLGSVGLNRGVRFRRLN